MWSVKTLLIFYKFLMRSWKILKKLFSLFKIEKFEGDYNNLNDNAIEEILRWVRMLLKVIYGN